MIKRIFSLVLAIVMAIGISVSVSGHEIPDYGKTGSVTVKLEYNGNLITGGSFAIFRVGNVISENGNYGFEFTEEFAECPVSILEINSSELPKALAKIAEEKKIEEIDEKINTNGTIKFENLEIGLYLIVQRNLAFGFNKISPFLVSVPAYENGQYIYDVNASPKVELEPRPTDPEDPPEDPKDPEDPPEGELPDTGLTSWPVPVMAAAGIVLLVSGILLRANGRNKKDES